MEFHVELVHAEVGVKVVRVEARQGEHRLGSSLGEAPTAEEAEDRARQRLQARLQTPLPSAAAAAAPGPGSASQRRPTTQPSAVGPPASAPETPPLQLPLEAPRATPADPVRRPPASASGSPGLAAAPEGPGLVTSTPGQAPAPGSDSGRPHPGERPPLATGVPPQTDPIEEPAADPEDWSSELLAVERQLRRIGWGREQEAAYLLRAFGHGSRSRLTRYGDLQAYLRALEAMEPTADPATTAVPLRRADLLAQADALLSQLGWGADQGRQLLERELGCSSRSQLNETQLLQFNMLLESEWLSREGDAQPSRQPVAEAAAARVETQR